MQNNFEDLGWDLLIVQRLLAGYGYTDETGTLYVWIPGLGEQEVTTTLQNMLDYLEYFKNVKDNERGTYCAGLKVGGLAG